MEYIIEIWNVDSSSWERVGEDYDLAFVAYRTGHLDHNNRKQGLWKYYLGNGNVWREQEYLDDVLSGTYKSYYNDGSINTVEQYKDGILNGAYRHYYNNGNLWESGNYVNGKKEGFWKSYFSNGALDEAGIYVEDKKDGYWRYYFKYDHLYKKVFFENNILVAELKSNTYRGIFNS